MIDAPAMESKSSGAEAATQTTHGSLVLSVQNVRVRFHSGVSLWAWVARQPRHTVEAVRDVTLQVAQAETLGLVGESGSGKTTLGRAVLRLNAIADGRIQYRGRSMLDSDPEWQRQLRREVQMVFQDPYSSLNPRMSVTQTLSEVLRFHRVVAPDSIEHEVKRLMDLVGLPHALARRLPRNMSGGQRQRVGLARALAVRPSLLVLDEPVAALDVSIQAQILNLLADLKRELSLAMLFIAHDLGVVRHVSDRVAVMYRGRIVEQGTRTEIFSNPVHPYTHRLLAAVPRVNSVKRRRQVQADMELATPAQGCAFAPRCASVQPNCRVTDPPLVTLSASHSASCFHPKIVEVNR